MEYVVAQGRRYHDSGQHRTQKKRPADAQHHHRAVTAKKVNAFAHLAYESLDRRFCRDNVSPQFRRTGHHVAALAHSQVKQERREVSGEVNEQHSAQPDVVVDKANDRSGNQPASLDSSQQKCVGVNELLSGGQFLDQSGNRGPEHPEAGGDQSIHQVKLPDFYFAGKRQDRNRQDDDGADRIQHHHQPAPVFAVDQNSGEGQHEHCG